MSKIILCDIPNTLFDSRYRTTDNTIALTGIKDDKLNYTAYSLLKDFHKLKYTIVLTHYALTRVSNVVEQLLQKHLTIPYQLYTNFASQAVYSNQTLKRHLSEQLNLQYVIDNDKQMRAYWLNQELGLITVPLSK